MVMQILESEIENKKLILQKLAVNVAMVCEHNRISTSVDTYIDPRIVYAFLLDNSLMSFEYIFFTPQLKAKHAWATHQILITKHLRDTKYSFSFRLKNLKLIIIINLDRNVVQQY